MKQSTIDFGFAGLNIALVLYPDGHPIIHPMNLIGIGFAIFLVIHGLRARKAGQ